MAMKPLPKEFQFKCDEHSREQCEKLGIKCGDYAAQSQGFYYVKDNELTYWDDDRRRLTIPLINLSDYLEDTPDHLELILQLTGQYVAGILNRKDAIIYDELKEKHYVEMAICHAEETVKQLKERGYLK